jgi:DNA-directed RNA polymerase subunit RPC12/RpoP
MINANQQAAGVVSNREEIMANTFNCPSCSAPLVTDGKETSIHCEYCGATVIVPTELQKAAQPTAESAPAPEPHPSQVEGPHGTLTTSQMRQMMMDIRAGKLDEATKTFHEGTGASMEMAGQTVQMIANQISASNMILPTQLASIMSAYAQSAMRDREPSGPAAGPQRRGSGIGCWLVLAIILVVFYFSYTSISPVDLVTSLIAGNTSAPVVQTAIAPLHTIATAISHLLK